MEEKKSWQRRKQRQWILQLLCKTVEMIWNYYSRGSIMQGNSHVRILQQAEWDAAHLYMCFDLEKHLIMYHSYSTVIILSPETKCMCSVERVCQYHCSPLGEQACASLVFWVGRLSLKYQNFYVFKLWWEWRPFSSYVCLSKQGVSKATVIWWTWYLTIQPVTEILAFHNLPVTVPFIWM